MSAIAQHRRPPRVLRSVENDSCPLCETGSLERDRYEGDHALVCDECGAPVVRVAG